MMCSGEACNLCGAGCWSKVKNCEHDVIDRHEEPERTETMTTNTGNPEPTLEELAIQAAGYLEALNLTESRHLAFALRSRVSASPAAPTETGGFTCDCCGRNMEVRINGKFCNECAGYRATPVVDEDVINNAADKIADYFNAPPSVIPAIEKIIQRCAAASPASTREDAEQTWCDHCSADLNGVKHILCERCYREFADSINTRESLRAAILDWLAHRCDRAPVCGICTYCRVAGFVRAVDPPTSPTPSSQPARDAAREWMNTHHASFETNRERENALATIISRYFPEP